VLEGVFGQWQKAVGVSKQFSKNDVYNTEWLQRLLLPLQNAREWKYNFGSLRSSHSESSCKVKWKCNPSTHKILGQSDMSGIMMPK
jgi:hypothetical protein